MLLSIIINIILVLILIILLFIIRDKEVKYKKISALYDGALKESKEELQELKKSIQQNKEVIDELFKSLNHER